MSTAALLVAPTRHPEPAHAEPLRVSSWIAEGVAARLGAVGVSVATWREAVERKNWQQGLVPPASRRGLAFYGHGDAHAVYGDDGKVLFDTAWARETEAEWLYAYACRAGVEWVHHAGGAHRVAAGYDVRLHVDLEPASTPPEVRDAFLDLAAIVPIALALGNFTGVEKRLHAAADRLVGTAIELGFDAPGWQIAAQQLSARLVLSPPS
ncbi:MAG: hypothetical protein FJ102_08135 [Deltaproteobacteria bacterium]|nr:hypothetical protein [Deltaproteobacteria bacterium]